ncbi:uncharacterized protein TNCV_4312051 [Trichonephila clavipes]|nr:uncharacterized protein TNCV_4312051 [Trichonephila clavipes]
MENLSNQSFTPKNLGRVDEEMIPRAAGYHNGAQLIFIKGNLISLTLRCRSKDWFEIFGYALVHGTATNFAQSKEALTENFPVVRNKKELEVKFYSSHQNRGQEPPDFIYDLLKIHKKLGLNMFEEGLVEHILARLEPQVDDYVEVRNPTTRAKLLQVISKFEERYSSRENQGSKVNYSREKRD